ncbi:MAG TPA: presenilin family intramembrane aspartyl protease PSH [Thermoplasmata archaeon]|nr:presenilin family intramembrane aspartyl protease PSH [Thermoplasmata archaeon]
MRREYASIAAMAAILVGSQVAAIALSPFFYAGGFQAFSNPGDVTNTAVYIIMILAFTAVILGLVRYRRQNLAKYVIIASIFVTLAFILLLPLYFGLLTATGGMVDENLLVNLSTLLAFVIAGLLVYVLMKFPEWYVVDAIGIMTAAGVTAILGISFGIVPAILLLLALAVYDAWAVYRTKHMITLADELTSQRLPILLVIPKKSGYSFRNQKSLKEQVASGEEREAMFVGLGDLIIPGILAVSAFTFSSPSGGYLLGILSNELIAIATVIGSLIGFLILMRFVLKGNPQAGLPLLNGGAVLGFLLANFLVYGYLNIL